MSTNLTTTDYAVGGDPIVVKEGTDSTQFLKGAGIAVVGAAACYGVYRLVTDMLDNHYNNYTYPQYPVYPGYYQAPQMQQPVPQPVNAPVYSYKDQNGVIRNAQTHQPIHTQQPVMYAQAPVAAPAPQQNVGMFAPQPQVAPVQQ